MGLCATFYRSPFPAILRDPKLVLTKPAPRQVAEHHRSVKLDLFDDSDPAVSALGADKVLGCLGLADTVWVAGVVGVIVDVHAIPILSKNSRSCMVIVCMRTHSLH